MIQGYRNTATSGVYAYYPDVIKDYPRFIETARRVAEGRDSVIFVDAASALEGKADPLRYLNDMMHLGPEGQPFLADLLFPHAVAALAAVPPAKTESR